VEVIAECDGHHNSTLRLKRLRDLGEGTARHLVAARPCIAERRCGSSSNTSNEAPVRKRADDE
jgi:hypothetical protein